MAAAGCSEKVAGAATVPTPAADLPATPAESATRVQVAAKVAGGPASVAWSDYSGLGFDRRAQLFTGLKALEAQLDGQAKELAAKHAALPGGTDTSGWEAAMKELNDSRTYLKSVGEDLIRATADTWVGRKEKVGQAWASTQAAVAKVKTGTTG